MWSLGRLLKGSAQVSWPGNPGHVMSAVLPTYARYNLAFERGEGAYLMTEDGERYLDFASGIAVTSLGHCHPHLIKALNEQAARVWHTSNLFHVPGQERLAQRLTDATFADKVFFTNSGSEAIECALKMARRHHDATGRPERYRVITFPNAFHGRTLAAIAAGGQAKHLEGFDPVVDGFDKVEAFEPAAVEAAIGPETAAILIEPVQGEGGIRPVPEAFLAELRAIADRHGLLLIFDEVQCGVGRTGRLFAHEWAGIAPDIMAIAKGIGGGFPVGACLANEKVAAAMTQGSHGSTFGGNPLAMAVGNAVLDVVLEPGFLEGVRETSLKLRQRLAELQDTYPAIVRGVRGKGLMLGLEVAVPPRDFIAAMIEARMLGVPAGDGVVRLLPPLTIGGAEIGDAYERLSATCRRLDAAARAKSSK